MAIGIGVLLFLQQNSVGRREFDEYKQVTQRWQEDSAKRIENRLERIEAKLDNATFKISKQTGFVGTTNFSSFFGSRP